MTATELMIVECDIPDPDMTLSEYRRSIAPRRRRTLLQRLRAVLRRR